MLYGIFCDNGESVCTISHNQVLAVLGRMMYAVARRFHLLAGHIGNAETAARRCDLFARCVFVGDKHLCFVAVKKLRYLADAYAINVMCANIAVLMKHNNIGERQTTSLVIFGNVDIETCVNIFKRHIGRKRRGIHQFVICVVNRMPRSYQSVVWLKDDFCRLLGVCDLVNLKVRFLFDLCLDLFLVCLQFGVEV